MTAFDKAWLLLKSDWDDLQSMYSNTHPIDTIDGLIDDFGDGDDEEMPYGGFGPNGETAQWFDDIMGNVSQGHTWYDDEHGGHFNSPERWRHYNAKVAEGNLTYGPERWRHYNAILPHSDDYSGWEPKQALDTVHHGTDKQFNSNSTDEEKIRHGLDLFPLMLGEDGVFSEEAPDWRASDNIAQWAVGDQWHNSVYGLKTIEKHFPDMKRDDIQRILREHAKGNDQFGNAYPDYSQQPHEEDWWYGDDNYNDEPIATGEPMDIAYQLLKRKKWPTTAQKNNRNWNNLNDEERLQIRLKRNSKGRKTTFNNNEQPSTAPLPEGFEEENDKPKPPPPLMKPPPLPVPTGTIDNQDDIEDEQ